MSWYNGAFCSLPEQGLFGCAPPCPQHPRLLGCSSSESRGETGIHISQGEALRNVQGKMAPLNHTARLSSGLGHCELGDASGFLKDTSFHI